VYTNQAPPNAPHDASKVPYNGWSNQGLREFNRLCEAIAEERKAFPHFDAQYSVWAAQFWKQRASKRKRRQVVSVYNKLDAFAGVASSQPPLEAGLIVVLMDNSNKWSVLLVRLHIFLPQVHRIYPP
jgi:phage tail protein X